MTTEAIGRRLLWLMLSVLPRMRSRRPGDGAARGRADDQASGRPGGRRLRNLLVAAVPAAAELVVGGYQLGGPSLWRDEGYTLNAAQRPVGRILALLGHKDAVHGLYYLLMHVDVSIFGSSTAALRLPSLVAMSLAAAVTAALAARLARATGLPAPAVTGMAAGLLLVAVPLTTWYAQDARPYALVSLFAVISTYALVRAAAERGWRWWAGYAVAMALTAMFSVFALLLLAVHGTSLGVAWARSRGQADARGAGARNPGTGSPVAASPQGGSTQAGGAEPAGGQPAVTVRQVWRWLAAAAAVVIVSAPIIVLGYRQAAAIGWLSAPGRGAINNLIGAFAGTKQLIPLAAVLALGGVAGDLGRRRNGLTLAVVALPWLVLPPLLLVLASHVHPVYAQRYVLFSLPAAALLTAGGLAGLARLVQLIPAVGRSGVVTALPSAAVAVVMAAALIGPQQAVRLTSARTDNLRAVSAVLAAHERPGDAILYVPWATRAVGMAYPAPFQRLRDIALRKSGVRSATLTGLKVTPPVLARRFATVRRLWTVHWNGNLAHFGSGKLAAEEAFLLQGMHVISRWHVRSVILSLYAASAPPSGG